MHPTTPTADSRVAAFDGLRGLAILVVILSHGWTLWPTDGLDRLPVVVGFFNSGNTAVTVFFAIGAFLLTRSLLATLEGSDRLPWRIGARRFIRLSSQVYPLLVAVAVVGLLDSSDPATDVTNRRSLGAVATYTWNWLLLNDAADARQDLGHLWYVSVDLQVSIALVVLVWALRRRLAVLAGVLAASLVLVVLWRAHVMDVEGWVNASLRTTTRCDPMLGGALVAVLTRTRPLGDTTARVTAVAGALGLLLVVGSAGAAGSLAFLGWAGAVAVLSTVALVAGLSAPCRPLARPLGGRAVRRLGTLSLALYVWHYPVFWAVARHSNGWHWAPRAALALAITGVVAVLTERYCERPTRGWLHTRRATPVATSSGAAAAG